MFLLTTIILILGIFTSYTDIKLKKIRNIHLLCATALGLAAYIYLIATHNIMLNINLTWNLLIGLGIGLLLYFTDTWGAGDAKLFMVYCFLMPTEKYSHILPFPSLLVFINIILVSTLAIVILSLGQIVRTRNLIFNKIFSFATLTMLTESFLIILSLKWLIKPIIGLLMPQMTSFLHILILFLLYRMVFKMITHKLQGTRALVIIIILGVASRFLFQSEDFNTLYLLMHLKKTALYTFVFYSLSVIFDLNKPDNKTERIMPSAPFMLLGTLLTNTNFLNWALQIVSALKK